MTIINQIENYYTKTKSLPIINLGDIITIKYLLSYTKPRKQVFSGICINKTSKGLASIITLRSSLNGWGIEYTFNLYSPLISEILIDGNKKTRKVKLYYLRNKSLKSSRIDS